MLARRFVLLVAVFVAGASGLPGAEVPLADMDVDMEEEEVRTLFASLSDDSFALREEAMLRLSKMGRGILPTLERLVKGAPDQETVDRCATIKSTIEGLVAKPVAYLADPDADPPPEAGSTIEVECARKGDQQGVAQAVLILDGRRSKGAPAERMRYAWKQSGGENLGLRPERMRRPRIGLMIYQPGEYRFELVVSDGCAGSAPAEVLVVARPPAEVEAEAGGDGEEKK